MNGNTHKAIGVATGCLVAAWGISSGFELAPLAMVAAPLGSMLPDIDHDRTKLGRKRKVVTTGIKIIAVIAIIVMCILIGVEAYKSRNIWTALLKLLVLFGPMGALVAVASIPSIKKQINFAVKHRGFMHTLIVPISCAIVVCTKLSNASLQWIVIGFMFGYISHLLADSITKDRCPLLWPITRKSVGLPIVSTGTWLEYASAALIIGGELWLAGLIMF